MRQITLAAATLAALAFASIAYADSNYGPRKNGDQCWHGQGSNSPNGCHRVGPISHRGGCQVP